MKPKVRHWHQGLLDHVWWTRSEAADYLRLSTKTLDRDLIPWEVEKEPVPGKMRRKSEETPGGGKRVRVLASDVLAVLPPQHP